MTSPLAEASMAADALLTSVRDVSSMGADFAGGGPLKADCVWLSRKVSLLSNLVEEIREFVSKGGEAASSSSSSSSSSASPPGSCLDDLLLALEAAKRFLLLDRPQGAPHNDVAGKNIVVQLCYVTWQLEKVLGDL